MQNGTTCHRVRRFAGPWQAADASLLEKCSLLYMSEVLWKVKTHVSGWLSALWSFVARAVWELIARSTSPAWDEVPAHSHAWSVVRVSKIDSGYVWTAVTIKLGCVPGKEIIGLLWSSLNVWRPSKFSFRDFLSVIYTHLELRYHKATCLAKRS